MPLSQLLIIYLIQTLIVFLPSFGFAKLFQKAGVPAWKAYIPFYNTWVIQEINQRPKHWVFWQFILQKYLVSFLLLNTRWQRFWRLSIFLISPTNPVQNLLAPNRFASIKNPLRGNGLMRLFSPL
jgi:hypothetical protein